MFWECLLSWEALLAGQMKRAKNCCIRRAKVFGIGFQLKDDLLDVYGDPEKFGKQVGGDIIANKKTFLLIEALSKSTGDLKQKLEFWINAESFDKEEKVAAVKNIYDELGIPALTEAKIKSCFDTGFESLEKLEVAPERKGELLRFVHQLVDREQ